MSAEVKLSMATQDFQEMRALLAYMAGKMDKDQLKATLAGLGYRSDSLDSRFDESIKFMAEKLVRVVS